MTRKRSHKRWEYLEWRRTGKSLKGKRFGRLVVLEATNKRKNRSVVWKCLCRCGKTVEVARKHLQRGRHTKSCGCLTRKANIKKGIARRMFPKRAYVEHPDADKRRRVYLSDAFVISVIHHDTGIDRDQISSKAVEAKREQVVLFRELKKGRKLLET